jgi:T5SS/PEP-CTERM-associated repeat protein
VAGFCLYPDIKRHTGNLIKGGFCIMKTRVPGRTISSMLLVMSLIHGIAQAKTTVGAFDQGWYSNSGNHSSTSLNTATSNTTNSFFAFDLGSLSETVTFGTLRLLLGSYFGANPQESFTVYGVATNVNTLLQSHAASDPEGLDIYQDLQSGPVYGIGTATPADSGTFLDITLTPDAIAAINSSAGGQFAVGLHLNVLDGGTLLFSFTPSSNILALNYVPGVDVSWAEPLGGTFSDGANWDRGSPPGEEDTAIFDVAGNGYTVNFTGSVTNKLLQVGNDDLVLDLGANAYTLNGNGTYAVQLNAGIGGTADLTVKNGTLSTLNSVSVGTLYAGISGSLTIDGVVWYGSQLITVAGVDMASQALLRAINGAHIETTGDIQTSYGDVIIDAADWINNGAMKLADPSYSNPLSESGLSVINGGTLEVDSLGAPYTYGRSADILVSGTGSSLTVTSLNMGGSGSAIDPGGTTATLTIEQGGIAIINDTLNMTSAAGAISTATIDGAGSSLSINKTTSLFNGLTVGFSGGQAGGEAFLTVSNGGTVNTPATYLGRSINSVTGAFGSGNVLVTGAGSSLVNTTSMSVGSLGHGVLTIEQGGTVSSTSGSIGTGSSTSGAPAAQGTVLVDGVGSQWTNNGTLTMGRYGSGYLTVQNGGNVFSQNGYVASSTGGGAGTVLITGAGSVWEVDGDCTIGNTGAGSLTIENSGTFQISGGFGYPALNVGPQGTLGIHNGTVSGGYSIYNSGVINLNGGEINTNVSNNSAFMIGAPATSTLNGNLTNNSYVKVTDTTFQVNGTFTNNGNYESDPSTNIFIDVIIGASGYFVGGIGDIFVVTGDLTNNSTQASLWNTDLATLIIDGPGTHNVTLGSEDYGSNGAADNFNWGTLQLGSGVQINLLDGSGGGAAMYVGRIALADGISQLSSINSAYPVYYNASLESNAYLAGQDYTLSGGGTLTPGTYPVNTAQNDGDLNADGSVNASDVLLAMRILTGQIGLTQIYLERGDVAPMVNGTPTSDGHFNLGDFLVILRMATGAIN